ncbi:hypothetical protein E4U13_005470 [Claviceps humidiphila]|uniref:Uncharacterized protein n=1 Tax=Claviceps humidiphila TaxID=1294629 RepID=A0A9P7PXW5_9HYPO|nr:hypothetical protein E4U13_005470 [Claviceps humidiphila]
MTDMETKLCGARRWWESQFGNIFLNPSTCLSPNSAYPETIAFTMADSIIRKACDRCHSQKLSLVGSQPSIGRRSPKRRRTSNERNTVLEQQALPILAPAEQTRLNDSCVSLVETSLNTAEFDFARLGHLGYFTPSSHGPLAQQQQGAVTSTVVEAFQSVSSFPEHWEQSLNPTADAFHPTPQPTLPAVSSLQRSPFPTEIPIAGLRNADSSRSDHVDKRRRSQLRNKPNKIALRGSSNAIPSKGTSSDIHWMSQLNEINSRLLDLASVLPQLATARCNIQMYDGAGDEGYPIQGFPIDEMFKLTRRVADVLDRICGEKDPVTPRMDSSDPGNSMFVLSIYVRLLDMFKKVFSLVRTELLQADAEEAFRFWRLPEVQIGSFAVDPSPSLQMSLTIQLAEEFLVRLRTATSSLDPALANGHGQKNSTGGGVAMEDCAVNGKSMFSDVVDVSYRAVKTKEESLGKYLVDLRDEIEALLE